MAKVKIQGHASGTGVLTVTAPNTSTDRTITLPDATATIATTTDVAARLPSITDNGNATAITIDSRENVGIGVVPETDWWSSTKAMQLGTRAAWFQDSGGTVTLSNNLKDDGTGSYLVTDEAARHSLNSNGTHTLQVAASGSADAAITWTTGFEVLNDGKARAKNGLLFGTDTAAANTLDDYEEGTWTPTISGNSTCSMGTIYNSHYTKIGNVVTLYTTFLVTSSATPATGALVFGGFPFAFKTLGESAFLISIYYNYKQSPMAFVNVNGNVYYQNTNVGGNNLGNLTEVIDSSNQFAFNFSYLTDA